MLIVYHVGNILELYFLFLDNIAVNRIIHNIICNHDHVQHIYLDMHTDLEL